MRRLVISAALAGLLGIGTAAHANQDPVLLTSVMSSDGVLSFERPASFNSGSTFSELLQFTLPTGTWDVLGDAAGTFRRVNLRLNGTGLTNLHLEIFGVQQDAHANSNKTGTQGLDISFDQANVIGGIYTAKVWGDYKTTGSYTFSLSAAPVPEPESYAMFLAGLGLMGTIARRRSKSKTV